MLTMKLVTSADAVDLLTAASLCRPDRLAANCRDIPGNKPADGLTASAKPTPLPVEPEGVPRDEDMRPGRDAEARHRSRTETIQRATASFEASLKRFTTPPSL